MISVLSYNVFSLRRGLAPVARVITACDADVVCLQEAPRFLFWRRRSRALARACGLVVVTGGRPAAANLLLAKPSLVVVATRSVKLPWHPPKHRRGVAAATFRTDDGDVVVASTHLSLDDTERLDQAARVLDLLGDAVPVVLVADVNETPERPAWRLLAERLADAGGGDTYSSEHPHKRIDGVFVDRRLDVLGCDVPDVPGLASASDHLPVLARIARKRVG